MLFPYTYVSHQMDKMQEFINFIFFEVWCEAPNSGAFSLELFDANAELKEVMVAFHYSDSYGAEFFSGHVERIYGLFAALDPAQINQLTLWYRANNNIERVCANDPAVDIARYADIDAILPDLSAQLASFFKELYSQRFRNVAALRQKIGDIDDHYKAFMGVNRVGKCPFCGIADIKGIYHSTREAYDHYLPKALYPFNSINFHNLVPACHNCNSSYKTSKDPAYTPKDPAGEIHRRKVFYPYANPGHCIELTVDLENSDIDHITPEEIRLTFGPLAIHEEIETWKDVYGIEDRYKAKFCDGDAKAWIEQIRILRDHGLPPQSSLSVVQEETEIDPFANANFLKNAFLKGCERAGVIDILRQP
ncbi:HNH endonuclease [Salidesulfovibrio onnuriiensis]|uniref:HNH endonuclease n=1 Tax=Salidesulfovibrio onnuriiensis TaxID=2583823 RepID=UPI0011C6F4AA|nr:hypothetical protein [Salidesulfovibrio onnuriiensis]